MPDVSKMTVEQRVALINAARDVKNWWTMPPGNITVEEQLLNRAIDSIIVLVKLTDD